MSKEKRPSHIKFYQNHRPSLSQGDYTIELMGSITHHEKISGPNTATKPLIRRFSVLGERFSLNKQVVRSVFPAANSTGHYAGVLPHVIFNRNTLPWERHAWLGELDNETLLKKQMPWMGLLLFDEEQTPKKQIITVQQLYNRSGEAGHFPDLSKESGQLPSEKLTVIDVAKDTLTELLPSADALRLLAHTRQGVDDTGQLIGEENAVLFCNRLPAQGKRSTMHLVSLEARYNGSGFDFPTNHDQIRLVSLKSWEFYTLEHFKVTSTTLEAIKDDASSAEFDKLSTLLDREFAGTEATFLSDAAAAAGLTTIPNSYQALFVKHSAFNKTFAGLLTHLNKDNLLLRLPISNRQTAETYLSQGLIPLEHHFRNGDRSVSWYRGPFVPTKPNTNPNMSVRVRNPRTADGLLRFDARNGMFNVTYAAAWEIGRVLAISHKDFSTSLFHWKRLIRQQKHKSFQSSAHTHLPNFAHTENHESAMTVWQKHLLPWLIQLTSFQSIPANYLIPKEALLQKESIRFFHVDQNWQHAALYGALSIAGDSNKIDQSNNAALNDLFALKDGYTTGFILRSDLVDGWPGLLIDGVDASGNTLYPLRRLLSRGILLCLFREEQQTPLQQIVFHQKGEVMHFGFIQDNSEFRKRKRDLVTGNEIGEPIVLDKTLKSDSRVIKIVTLARKLNLKDRPAEFAMTMVEGVPRIIFNLS